MEYNILLFFKGFPSPPPPHDYLLIFQILIGGPFEIFFVTIHLEHPVLGSLILFLIMNKKILGFDWLDVSMCMKPSQVESICQKLEENFEKQSKVNQDYYYSRYMAMKSSLYRLVSVTSDYKAADCYAQLMLYSIHGVFKSLLGPSDMIVTADTQTEKVFKLIRNQLKDEASIGKKHALNAQFVLNTSCFWKSTGSTITPVVQFHGIFVQQ